MLRKSMILISIALMLISFLTYAQARLTPAEIARLGKDLTPFGGEKTGKKDGTIPSWTGGFITPPASYKLGMHHPDPFLDNKPLFTITAENMDRYAEKLTSGHKAMLKIYKTFRMNVYPTRRSASNPERIYKATKKFAATAELVDGGNGVRNSVIGIPFPIPKNGLEVIWNHLLRYRGDMLSRRIAQASLTLRGKYALVKFEEEVSIPYSHEGMTEEELDNCVFFLRQKVVAPARLAGGILLVHETLNQVKEPRSAWQYNPGQRRVRRAPNVAYDNPGTASDGLRTNDQYDMFNGATDRYNWKLEGKKEIFVPYNSYKLHSNTLTYKDILTPLHINPDYCRYELHRVWVVNATLKEGKRHLYKRRTFYVDEDSWNILLVDIYDNRDQLWRISEAHVINYYEIPAVMSTLEVHTDLQSGRYLAVGLDNESTMYDFSVKLTPDDFTPAALRREGKR